MLHRRSEDDKQLLFCLKTMPPIKNTVLPLLLFLGSPFLFSGVSREIQQEFRQRYEGHALFLGLPLYGSRTVLPVRPGGAIPEKSTEVIRFKVGEQVRVQEVSFGGMEIRFKLSGIEGGSSSELIFRFAAELDEGFSARSQFETALQRAFTEGRRYSDLDQTKKEYIRNQLQQVIQEMMTGTTADREFVMDALAEALPPYRTAVEEGRKLREEVKELSAKFSSEQTRSRQFESKLVEQSSELNRLKSVSQSMKTDLEAVSASSSSANSELRQLRQQQTEITSSVRRLQRGLGITPEASKSLAGQVEELMVASLKNKGEGDQLNTRLKNSELELEKKKAELQDQLKANNQLTAENTRLQDNIKLLSNRGDQLGSRYIQLQKEKVQLENFVRSVQTLRSRVVSETGEKNRIRRITELLLQDTLVATLETDYPTQLQLGERAEIRTRFTTASVNFVKLSEEEKRIFTSLGDKLNVRCELRNLPDGVRVVSSRKDSTQTISERSTGEWTWTLESSRIVDANPFLLTMLVNQNRDAVPVVHNQLRLESVNMGRLLNSFMAPIPMAIGVVFGVVLFAAFQALSRRSRRHRKSMTRPSAPVAPSRDHIEL